MGWLGAAPFLFPILQRNLPLNYLHYDHMVGYAISHHHSMADNYSNTGNRSEEKGREGTESIVSRIVSLDSSINDFIIFSHQFYEKD